MNHFNALAWEKCPKCKNEALEHVDTKLIMESDTYIQTWVCHHCGHEATKKVIL